MEIDSSRVAGVNLARIAPEIFRTQAAGPIPRLVG
jgi:hypothetical protein